MKSTSYLMIFLLFVVGTSGCCVLGKNVDDQKFDASALDRLTANQTPAAEICEIFGAPNQVIEMSNGNAYIYRHSVSKATAVWLILVSMGTYDKQYDQIVFFFDNKDILTHYGASFNAEDASYGLPF